MPRINNLTDEGRRKAGTATARITQKRKANRIERVRELQKQGKTIAEMAKKEKVSERTIRRDLEAIEKIGT